MNVQLLVYIYEEKKNVVKNRDESCKCKLALMTMMYSFQSLVKSKTKVWCFFFTTRNLALDLE
jgi:hypothetical protein